MYPKTVGLQKDTNKKASAMDRNSHVLAVTCIESVPGPICLQSDELGAE